jgi:hypothetical protein
MEDSPSKDATGRMTGNGTMFGVTPTVDQANLQSWNRCAYVQNIPTGAIDQFGLAMCQGPVCLGYGVRCRSR